MSERFLMIRWTSSYWQYIKNITVWSRNSRNQQVTLVHQSWQRDGFVFKLSHWTCLGSVSTPLEKFGYIPHMVWHPWDKKNRNIMIIIKTESIKVFKTIIVQDQLWVTSAAMPRVCARDGMASTNMSNTLWGTYGSLYDQVCKPRGWHPLVLPIWPSLSIVIIYFFKIT